MILISAETSSGRKLRARIYKGTLIWRWRWGPHLCFSHCLSRLTRSVSHGKYKNIHIQHVWHQKLSLSLGLMGNNRGWHVCSCADICSWAYRNNSYTKIFPQSFCKIATACNNHYINQRFPNKSGAQQESHEAEVLNKMNQVRGYVRVSCDLAGWVRYCSCDTGCDTLATLSIKVLYTHCCDLCHNHSESYGSGQSEHTMLTIQYHYLQCSLGISEEMRPPRNHRKKDAPYNSRTWRSSQSSGSKWWQVI